MAKPKDEGQKVVLDNRRARFNYELGERYEAGLQLLGSEVKTLRRGTGDLTDGWVAINKGEAFLKGLFLPRLQHAAFGHEERRERRLLLHEREIYELKKAIEQGGLSVIPLSIYWKNGRAKVELAISKGRKMADKRHAIKERELDREAKAAVARGRRGE